MSTTVISNPNGYALDDIVKAVIAILQPAAPKPVEQAYNVPEASVKNYDEFDEYPAVLQAKHVRAILGLSEAKTYEVLNSKKCPSFTAGKRILVRKKAFLDFLAACDGQDLII